MRYVILTLLAIAVLTAMPASQCGTAYAAPTACVTVAKTGPGIPTGILLCINVCGGCGATATKAIKSLSIDCNPVQCPCNGMLTVNGTGTKVHYVGPPKCITAANHKVKVVINLKNGGTVMFCGCVLFVKCQMMGPGCSTNDAIPDAEESTDFEIVKAVAK